MIVSPALACAVGFLGLGANFLSEASSAHLEEFAHALALHKGLRRIDLPAIRLATSQL